MASKEEYGEIMTQHFIGIDKELKDACPDLCLGVITADVVVEKRNDLVWSILQDTGKNVVDRYSLDTLVFDPSLRSARETYRKLGKDPARYRVSSEALMRRVLQGKGLYKINNIVDINNILSLEKALPSGAYDLSRLRGGVNFRVGRTGEAYKGIGKEAINIADLPVFADEEGPFGSPTSDSERAMITLETNKVMIVLISFSGDLGGQLEEHIEKGKTLLRDYAHGANITTTTIH